MTLMPYHPGCPKCDAVREYFLQIDRAVDEAKRKRGGPFMVGMTINAADIPRCQEHLEYDDD